MAGRAEPAARSAEAFESSRAGVAAVQGFLHRPPRPGGDGLVLTHGAGGDCNAPLLVALATAFADAGLLVLRIDLPYRQARRKGPPAPAGAARDREGLRRAVEELRRIASRRAFLGGQSYGGRQASLLAAEAPEAADALLLLSYPLHPPGRAAEMRTAHFPRLRTPVLFAHGSLDPFGSLDELDEARRLVPAPTELLCIDGAGHGLSRGRQVPADVITRIVEEFLRFTAAAQKKVQPQAPPTR